MAKDSKKPEEEADNSENESLEEDLLDQALGLDEIDVTGSEVMDQFGTTKMRKKKKVVEKMIGIDHVEDDTNISGQIGSVNSL